MSNPSDPSHPVDSLRRTTDAGRCRIPTRQILKLVLVGIIVGIICIAMIFVGMFLLLSANMLLLLPLHLAGHDELDRRAHLTAILFGAYLVLAVVLAGNVIREQIASPGYNGEHVVMVMLPALFLGFYACFGTRLCRNHNKARRIQLEG